jgi:fructose-1,6-bisphosphatase/inositol monophosphatase family enzyme
MKGHPTLQDEAPIALADKSETLSASLIASTVPEIMFATAEKWSGFQALRDAARGCVTDQNCVGFMRLLQPESGIGVVYEADLAYHDAAALVPILEGAGMRVTDSGGHPLSFPKSAIGSEFTLLAAAPSLHRQALSLVQQGVEPEKNSFAGNFGTHQGYAQKFLRE